MTQTIRRTQSVCPICLKQIPARLVRRGSDYYLTKSCPTHGDFSAVVWRGTPELTEWTGDGFPEETGGTACPDGCGLCGDHLQKTCCVLVEVTSRCNLGCPVCFAHSGEAGSDVPLDDLRAIFRRLVDDGRTFVQLSGGEPTVRDDLPEIVAAARDAGCENIQLNTNGLRLGAEPTYTRALRDAGLSFVFMQFDGTEDAIYEKLRGRPLLAEKKAAIDVCADNLLGVTLVPTVVPGVNDHNIGAIVRFGLKRSPDVRGVHFQPVSYFGRYPSPPSDADRITLPEIIRAIETQTNGKIKVSDFGPSCCDHPRCSFHGDFVVLPRGMVLRLSQKSGKKSCCTPSDAHLKNRAFVSRRWKRTSGAAPDDPDADYQDIDTFLSRVHSHGFTITGMAFQDAYTLDIERLRRCSLHVYDNDRIIPFCARYLSGVNALES